MAVPPTLREQILLCLTQVMDPETEMDVITMRLVENLTVDEATGTVRYRFRPSSPLCPIALDLARKIKQAIASVPGVQKQEIEVTGYIRSCELQTHINQD